MRVLKEIAKYVNEYNNENKEQKLGIGGQNNMANKQKQKGTRFETAIVKELAKHNIKAERIAPHGNKDIGDILVENKLMIEAKAYKQKITLKQLKNFQEQTLKEIKNGGYKIGALVIKQAGSSIENADVWGRFLVVNKDKQKKRIWRSFKLLGFIDYGKFKKIF